MFGFIVSIVWSNDHSRPTQEFNAWISAQVDRTHFQNSKHDTDSYPSRTGRQSPITGGIFGTMASLEDSARWTVYDSGKVGAFEIGPK